MSAEHDPSQLAGGKLGRDAEFPNREIALKETKARSTGLSTAQATIVKAVSAFFSSVAAALILARRSQNIETGKPLISLQIEELKATSNLKHEQSKQVGNDAGRPRPVVVAPSKAVTVGDYASRVISALALAVSSLALVVSALSFHFTNFAKPEDLRVTAILASALIKDSVHSVKRYAETRPHPPDSAKTGFGRIGIHELASLPKDHSFIDALEALIDSAASGGLADIIASDAKKFSSRKAAVAPIIEVAALTPGTVGDIRIAGIKETTVALRYARPDPWDRHHPKNPPSDEIDAWATKTKGRHGP